MGKTNNSMGLLPFTSGAGVAIGTDVDIGAVITSNAATTVTIDVDGTVQFQCSSENIVFSAPVALVGVVTATSSGGSFAVQFRQRPT